jgi:hypothetical protein
VITVRLSAPRGAGPAPEDGGPSEGFTRDVAMPAIPHVGEMVKLKVEDDSRDYTYAVHAVVWCPDEFDFQAYVVLR